MKGRKIWNKQEILIYHLPVEYNTGEKQINGRKQKVVDHGYFIAKVKDETLSFYEIDLMKNIHRAKCYI